MILEYMVFQRSMIFITVIIQEIMGNNLINYRIGEFMDALFDTNVTYLKFLNDQKESDNKIQTPSRHSTIPNKN
jgi:hypothetical protein